MFVICFEFRIFEIRIYNSLICNLAEIIGILPSCVLLCKGYAKKRSLTFWGCNGFDGMSRIAGRMPSLSDDTRK